LLPLLDSLNNGVATLDAIEYPHIAAGESLNHGTRGIHHDTRELLGYNAGERCRGVS